MFELLLYTSIECTDAARILDGVKKHPELTNVIKKEIIVELKRATPECKWDAND